MSVLETIKDSNVRIPLEYRMENSIRSNQKDLLELEY